MLTVVKLFQLYLEVHGTTSDHVLYFEFGEFYRWVAHTLYILGILFGRLLALHLTFGACDDHLSILEYQGGSPRFFNSQNQRCESLWIILSITTIIAEF